MLQIKNRSVDRGFILIAASVEQLTPFTGALAGPLKQKIHDSWPGPVTWILPCDDSVSEILTGGKKTIATRVTDHPIASALCDACDSAIISTSANVSGQPPCTDSRSVAAVFGDQLAYTLDYDVGNLTGPTPIFDGISGRQLR